MRSIGWLLRMQSLVIREESFGGDWGKTKKRRNKRLVRELYLVSGGGL